MSKNYSHMVGQTTPESVLVSFDVIKDVPDVTPPFVKGTRDSIWVYKVDGENIKTTAKKMFETCYGKGIAVNFR